MLWDEMNACWPVISDEELIDALHTIKLDRTYQPYAQECVDPFIDTIVYNKKPDLDVLAAHRDLILRKQCL